MPSFHLEHRTLQPGASLGHDLAQHIFIRGARDTVAVVTDRPQDLLSVTKKQWYVLIRLVQRERSSTLKAARIAELSNQLSWMQHLRFTTKLSDNPPIRVVFASANELIKEPPICATLYIAQHISTEQFHLITSWMPKGGVVVVYEI